MWRNWARDQYCVPVARVAASGREDVVAAVGRAAGEGRAVRAVGAGHSFSEIALTNGYQVALDAMDRVLDVDPASGLVRVQAGISIHALSRRLAEHGLALANLGDVDRQSLAGAIATATHGTGARLGNIGSQVTAVQLVAGDGSVVELDESDPDGLRAARASLGALGIVTELTVRCVPAFTLSAVDAPLPLDETLARLDELADAHDHFELFVFPHARHALTRANDRTDAPPAPRARAHAWADDVLLANHAFHAFCLAGRAFPRRIPVINRLVTRLAGASRRVDRSFEIFASPRLVRFTEMEYALPRAHTAEAVRAVMDLVERRGFAVPFPIECRFVAPDDALLSTAYGRETGYVAVHMFRGMEWEPYFRAVAELMDALDGRPHWGKRHFQTAGGLRLRYPEWDRFQAVRARLDPEGRFANAYLDRVLGRFGAPVAAG
jgi:L-gulonolactone oxidase